MHLWKITELKKMLELGEAVIKAIEEKEKLIEAQAKVEKSKVVAKDRFMAMVEFKASINFAARSPRSLQGLMSMGSRLAKHRLLGYFQELTSDTSIPKPVMMRSRKILLHCLLSPKPS
ncbi:hypothetical protein COCNU_11G006150 [Cocos nucifera]|uniref:Uncharacterized protein n=1 Tax=Cocos nucifera TaxID=13894 RepID=A0A8K0N9F1_COCNU|nr:hypothetical protein COCNU_11G006150 [Cocos nucifera]